MLNFNCTKCEKDHENIYVSRADQEYYCWKCLPITDKSWHRYMEERIKQIKRVELADKNEGWYVQKPNNQKPLISINNVKL